MIGGRSLRTAGVSPAALQRPRARRPRYKIIVAACLLALTARSQAGFAPPLDQIASDHAMSAIRDCLTSQQWDAAVTQIEAALANGPVLAKEDDRIIPLTTAITEQLSDEAARKAFADAYEKSAGPAATTALSEAVRNGNIAAMANVATRWPWTQAATRVPTEMANRLATVGDLSGVQSLLRTVPAAPAALQPLAKVPTDSAGKSVLTSAAWYNLVRPVDFPRSTPVSAKDTIYIASPTATAAVTLAGKVLWTLGSAPPPLAIPKQAERLPKSMQEMLFAEHALAKPAVWCDGGGEARIVVVRQSKDGASALTAVRASDGSPLWSTADSDTTQSLLMLGSPHIHGRYVYSLALDYQPPALPKMNMVAIDLTSGTLLWRTSIGDATANTTAGDPRAAMGISFVPSLIATSPVELSSDDKAVYVSLEGGNVISLDRFGGSMNWIAPYTATPADRRDLQRLKNGKNKIVLHRYRDCVAVSGNIALVAPTDSPTVVAYDTATGKRTWMLDNVDGAELVGVAGGNFILAGEKLMALSANGAIAWQVDYTNAPTGPAIIEGDQILTPTQSGVTIYAGATGKYGLTPPREIMSTDYLRRQAMGKKTLDELHLLDTFATPTEPAPPPPKPVKQPVKKK